MYKCIIRSKQAKKLIDHIVSMVAYKLFLIFVDLAEFKSFPPTNFDNIFQMQCTEFMSWIFLSSISTNTSIKSIMIYG